MQAILVPLFLLNYLKASPYKVIVFVANNDLLFIIGLKISFSFF